jgi:hypothetical protein
MGGNPFTNGNIYTVNGIGYTEIIKLNSPLSIGGRSFDFTGAFFNSIFNLRRGVFEARIKFPNDPNFFDAFWLQSRDVIDQEIDICEFFDGNLGNGGASGNCDNYHQVKMTLHNRSIAGAVDCKRGRKFPVAQGGANDFLEDFHTYKCVWTDYRVDFYVDNDLKGYATRYYDGPYTPSNLCQKHAYGDIPWNTQSCSDMQGMSDCARRIWVPNWPDVWNGHYECRRYNKVDKDISFPRTDNIMNLILNAIFNYANPNCGPNLINNWPTHINDRRMAVDWVKVYQPVDCGANHQLNTLSDMKNITGKTNFLAGSSIRIGNSTSNANFQNTMGLYYQGNEFPIHLLASEEIEINGEAIFEDGTFLRAEIFDCTNGGFNESQRTLPGGEKLFLTDEEIKSIEQQQIDSLLAANPALHDSINAYHLLDNEPLPPFADTSSIVNNMAVQIMPNPANNSIYIGMDEEDYNDVMSMEILSAMQAPQIIPKSQVINISNLTPGVYQLRITLTQGYVVVKPFIKIP